MHNQVFVSDEQTNGLDDEAFNRMPPSPWCEKLNSTMTNHPKCRKYVDYQQVYATILNTNKVHLCTFQLFLIAIASLQLQVAASTQGKMELCTYMDDEEDEHSDIDSSATESRKLMKLMCN